MTTTPTRTPAPEKKKFDELLALIPDELLDGEVQASPNQTNLETLGAAFEALNQKRPTQADLDAELARRAKVNRSAVVQPPASDVGMKGGATARQRGAQGNAQAVKRGFKP